MARKQRVGHALVATVVGLLAVTASAAPAVAGTKPFRVEMAPVGSQAANTNAQYEATITNLDPQQTLGSVNLTAPAEFKNVRTESPYNVDGSTVRIRGLNLAAGDDPVRVPITVDNTSATGYWDWAAAGKQANNFAGTGNNFTLDGSSKLTVYVEPNSGPGGSRVQCELDIECGLTVTYRHVEQSGALADSTPTSYTISVSVSATPVAPAVNAGILELALPARDLVECAGTFSSPKTSRITGPNGRSKTVKTTVDMADDFASDPGAVCYAAPNPFITTEPGTPFLDGGTLFLSGRLPDCASLGTIGSVTPCARSQLVGGDHEFEVETPATVPDPYYRG